MKLVTTLTILIVLVALSSGISSLGLNVSAQDTKKPQDTYTLATEAKLGPVMFSHLLYYFTPADGPVLSLSGLFCGWMTVIKPNPGVM